MWPVLALCASSFVVTAACHLLGIAGVLHGFSRASAWALMGVALGGFWLAMLTHPKREFGEKIVTVNPWRCLEPMQPWLRVVYVALWLYSVAAVVLGFPEPQLRAALPAVLEEPFFLTACVLAVSVSGLAVSHSGLLIRQRSARGPKL